MTVAKMKGHLADTTGKLAGDMGMRDEGEIEDGVAEVQWLVTRTVDYTAEIVGRGVNAVTNATTVVRDSAKATIKELF